MIPGRTEGERILVDVPEGDAMGDVWFEGVLDDMV